MEAGIANEICEEGESVIARLKIRVTGFAGRFTAKPEIATAVPSPRGEGQDEGEPKNQLPRFIPIP